MKTHNIIYLGQVNNYQSKKTHFLNQPLMSLTKIFKIIRLWNFHNIKEYSILKTYKSKFMAHLK